MRKLIVAIVAGVMLAPPAAGARDWSGIPVLQLAQGDMKKDQGQYRRGDDGRRRDQQEPPPPRRDERHGRMTDEERRELHRDLDRANREIYRQKGR